MFYSIIHTFVHNILKLQPTKNLKASIIFELNDGRKQKNLNYFKLFSLFKQLYITIQFSISTVSISKKVQFHTI